MRAPALAVSVLVLAAVALSACSGPERRSDDRPRTTRADAGAPASRAAARALPSLDVPEDTGAPDGPACARASDCEDPLQCRGAPGCTGEWACGAPRECLAESVSYCDCDGATFYAPGGCPGRPYAHLGPCETMGELVAAGTELGVHDWDEQPTTQDRTCESSGECGGAQICFGIAGCATEWRCVRARGCSRERVTFCGCDGESFVASSTCPGRPFVHRGECRGEAIASAEVPATGAAAREADAGARARTRERDAGAIARAGESDAGAIARGRERDAGAQASRATDAGAAIASRAPGSCHTSRDCPRGQVCQGDPGCGMEWTCGRPERECIRDTQVFCDCEGRDFRASMFCPGRPFAHRGSCEIDRLLDLSGAATR